MESGGKDLRPILAPRVGRQRQRRNISSLLRGKGANFSNQNKSILFRHGDIADQDIWPELFKYMHRFLSR